MILPLAALAAAPDEEIVAVSARASNDYIRAKQPNGSFQPEFYTFGKGGFWAGEEADKTIDTMNFLDVARTMADPLRSQNFLPSTDPKATRLLIMVYWGVTQPARGSESMAYQGLQRANQEMNELGITVADPKAVFRDPTGAAQAADNALTGAMALVAMENHNRDRINRQNAAMLGYDSWWDATKDLAHTPMATRWQDMIDELEQNRYFVVLMAYDFQLMWKQKKTKLLWETRFSIRGRGHNFNEQLAAMTQDAAKYFGHDSRGLVHQAPREGRVDLGELKVIGDVPEKGK